MGYTLKEIVQDWRDIQSRNDTDDERILELVEKMKQMGIAFPDKLENMSTDELRAYLEKKYYFVGPSLGTGGNDTNGEQNKPVGFALIPKYYADKPSIPPLTGVDRPTAVATTALAVAPVVAVPLAIIGKVTLTLLQKLKS